MNVVADVKKALTKAVIPAPILVEIKKIMTIEKQRLTFPKIIFRLCEVT